MTISKPKGKDDVWINWVKIVPHGQTSPWDNPNFSTFYISQWLSNDNKTGPKEITKTLPSPAITVLPKPAAWEVEVAPFIDVTGSYTTTFSVTNSTDYSESDHTNTQDSKSLDSHLGMEYQGISASAQFSMDYHWAHSFTEDVETKSNYSLVESNGNTTYWPVPSGAIGMFLKPLVLTKRIRGSASYGKIQFNFCGAEETQEVIRWFAYGSDKPNPQNGIYATRDLAQKAMQDWVESVKKDPASAIDLQQVSATSYSKLGVTKTTVPFVKRKK
jgi:hypothetical protein